MFWALTGIAAAFIGGTWLLPQLYPDQAAWDEGSPFRWLWLQLDLNTENTLATWFSSMVVLLVAVTAATCHVADRSAGVRTRLALVWVLLALLFLGLSLDELGSLHERLGQLASLPGSEEQLGWRLLLGPLILVVAGLLLAFAWTHLRRRSRLSLGLFAAGTLIWMTVPLQEQGIVVGEEGSELAGALCFLAAVGIYLLATAPSDPDRRDTHSIELAIPRRTAIACGLGIVVSLGLGTLLADAHLAGLEGDEGLIRNWFPATVGTLTAILALGLWRGVDGVDRTGGLAFPAVAVLALFLSAYYGANMQGWLSVMSDEGQALRIAANAAVVLFSVALAAALYRAAGPRWVRLVTIGFPVFFAVALTDQGNFGGAVDYAAMTLLLCSVWGRVGLPPAAPGPTAMARPRARRLDGPMTGSSGPA